MKIVNLNVPPERTRVMTGWGIAEKLSESIDTAGLQKASLFVIADSKVYGLHRSTIEQALKQCGRTSFVKLIDSRERSKAIGTATRLSDWLLSKRIERTDFVLAIGGGVISDIVGFVASTILRGVEWGVISTTVIGMADAAIGGKTGVNTPRGKNLIGTIWHPRFVINDLALLQTLPQRELLAGFGELFKYACLKGGELPGVLRRCVVAKFQHSSPEFLQLMAEGIEYKAGIVERDAREAGERALLNFGHTFGHAMEKVIGYGKIRHGEAVTLGILCAARLSVEAGFAGEKDVQEVSELGNTLAAHFRRFKINPNLILAAMTADKKRVQGRQKFILLRRPGKPIITDEVSKEQIKRAVTVGLRDYL